MERLRELLPLLIFILIPVLRGLNNSKKQKREYQQRRRNVNTFPSQDTKSLPPKPWRSIIDEVGNDMRKGFLGSEAKPEKKTQHRTKQDINYSEDKVNAALNSEKIIDYIGNEKVLKDLKRKSLRRNALEFSTNPLVQGLIFSEILGPPKSRK